MYLKIYILNNNLEQQKFKIASSLECHLHGEQISEKY